MRKLKLLIIIILIPISAETYIRFIHPKIFHKRHHAEYPADTRRFLNAMAKLESGGDPTVISSTGYLGKYQFSYATLKGLGFTMPADSFLHDEMLQDSAMLINMKSNARALQKYMECCGYHIGNNVLITKSGMLAGSHTHGAGAVINFINSDGLDDNTDGNGVKISDRISQFSNITLNKF